MQLVSGRADMREVISFQGPNLVNGVLIIPAGPLKNLSSDANVSLIWDEDI